MSAARFAGLVYLGLILGLVALVLYRVLVPLHEIGG